MDSYIQTNREKQVFDNVLNILKKHLNPSKIILFGSRVKGEFKYYSDFDFAVDSRRPELDKQRTLVEEIENSAGLYSVDIVYLNSVEEEFKKLILKSGTLVYERGN